MSFVDEKLKWIEFYAGHGLRVLPVWGVTKNLACQCPKAACETIGKHPILADWPKVATTDLPTLRSWWQKHPDANIGIATSAAFTILDIDPRNGGDVSLDELVRTHGADAFISPWRVRTGGGGWHLAYRTPPGTRCRNGVKPGIDIKAEGGFVVVPFSLHASGTPYGFDPPLTALDLSMLRELPSALQPSSTTRTSTTASAGKLGTGSRNDTLASIAGKLRDRGAGQQEIEAALKSVNAIVCDPPLSDAEIQRTAASIAKYPAGVPPKISFIGADELVAKVPPNIVWVVPGLVAIGAVTELTGQPKEAGKSTLVRAMVASMLAGSTFAGAPTMRSSVVMLSEERDHTLSHAIAQHKIASGEVRVLQRHRLEGGPSWPQIVEASVAEMKRIGARVLVVDTLSYWALGDADENSASDALKGMEPLLKAATEGIAIIIVRHMRKSGGETVTSARGSSAITGAVDIVCTLASHSAGNTFRVLDATGRFRESVFKTVLELTATGVYVAHGTGQQLAQQARLALENLIISLLPDNEAAALTEKDILASLASTATPIGRTKLAEILKELIAANTISCTGRGTNKDPRRYWAP